MTVVNLREQQDLNEEVKKFIENIGDLNEKENAILCVQMSKTGNGIGIENVIWTQMNEAEINFILDLTKSAILYTED